MHRMMRRAAVTIGAAAASCAVLAGPAVAAPAQPAVHNVYVPDCNTLVYKPSSIVLACADANMAMEHAHWHTWTQSRATGTADFVYNDCVPNCADGHMHSYRGNVELYLVHSGKPRNWFSRLHFQYPNGGPGGKGSSTYALHLS